MKRKTDYAYSVARIRAMERRLLDRVKIETMLEAKSAADALKVLAEADYAPLLAEIKDVYQYEKVLSGERKRVYELLQKIAPEQEIINLFALKYDYHNLKVLLKAKFLGEDAAELLTDAGSVAPEEFARLIAAEDYAHLPAQFRPAVTEAATVFAATNDPQTISFTLDRVLYEQLTGMAKNYGSDFLQQYFRIQIDLLNIGTYLRVKNLKKSREFLGNVLLDHGTLEKKVFMQLYNEADTADALISRLGLSVYGAIVEEGVRDWAKNHSTTHFEKLADNYLLEFVKSAKRIIFGVEPLLAYLLAKDVEIRIIRMIMVGKLNGIPVEEIRERLRDAYA